MGRVPENGFRNLEPEIFTVIKERKFVKLSSSNDSFNT